MRLDDTTCAVCEFCGVLPRRSVAWEEEFQLSCGRGTTIRSMTGVLRFVCNITPKIVVMNQLTEDKRQNNIVGLNSNIIYVHYPVFH